jgi:hypothetical protein
MKTEDYPALYQSASLSSASAQKQYLLQVGSQYALLILAAVSALLFDCSSVFLAAYAFLLIASTAMLLISALIKPEKDWYAGRALAESLKTSTWRYMMNAEPFARTDTAGQSRTEFAKLLKAITDANEHVRRAIRRRPVEGDQITAWMEEMRAKPLAERIAYYLDFRIRDQKNWYVNKAKWNRSRFRDFVAIGVIVQSLAIILAIIRFKSDNFLAIWPTEPLLVFASATVGWIQIKKFNELASAYSLTAHEIGIIESRLTSDLSETEWSDFVNEAELAFSREHTQWVARQDAFS